MFIVLLASIVNASSHTKYVFLSNQKNHTSLHPKEYSQEFH